MKLSPQALVRRFGALAASFLLTVSVAPGWAAAPDTVTAPAVVQQPEPASNPDAARSEAPAPSGEKPDAQGGETGKDEKESWDVNAPPLPTSTVEIDVDEGTWMSLDVSPEGDEIVFDLLGDLYTLPIAGGEAKALTEGMAWDMQPRYSPDGRFIAFTSDRAGGDNLWLIKRDGSDAKAITDEKFRLLNSPVWTPDGQYVAGRKHFTKTRSLGSGEIWLYHRSGGEGVQMVEKPNDQKDLGEPAFSPDGRYLYYSRDTTPGPVFEYNKDPNGEIYAIFRVNRETGETQKLIGGPGGAVRPTPSPDGRYLAFVRRVRAHSVLELLDLESGSVRPLYGDLERDMQETWAIHGVYPVMAWTPDSRSLVFWAAGKIHRLWTGDDRVEEIPFHVRSTRMVAEALHFANDPAPDTFHTKMLRWVEVAPAGDKVVFQALGHLWIRDLPDGKPRRLTSQNDHFELFPTFTRDGKWVVYTTWNDEKLGDVRVVSAAGGAGRVLTEHPGHYIEPAVSPDSKTVIYRKIEGGWLLDPRASLDPGVYRIPFAGGAARRLAADGTDPHFGAALDRVYLERIEDDGSRSLVSVTLDGLDERVVATSDWATRFRVSPDGRWLAFTERFNAYVTPFPEIGTSRAVGPGSMSLPTRKVTRDAGTYLQWAGDSSGLYWSLGPELYSRRLPDLFAFLDGAPEELPDPPESGRDIGFDVAADRPDGTIALVGGRVVTMKGDEVIEDGTVVIDGNHIVAVGPRAQVAVPAGARTVDVSGHTVLPGIVDVHWHGEQGSSQIIPEQNWFDYATLTYGVTTLHDPSNDTAEIFAAAEMARAGEILAPRIFSTGTILYGATTAFTAKVDSLDDALGHLRRMKAVGAFSVKSYNQPRRDQRQQILKAARELGMLVVPEGGSLFEHNMTMVVDGHTGVEHSIPVPHIYADVEQLWSGTKVGYTPTLIVGYGGIFGEDYWYQHTDVWQDERLSHFVPRRVLDARSRRRVMAPEEEYGHVLNAQVAKRLHDLGVEVHVGAHGQREGLGAHWEMWMLVQGGMTPSEALHVATIEGARYLGMDEYLGSIETGKLADLMVLEKNPLDDIRNSTAISHVVLDGRLYDARTLDELAPESKPAKPFFFDGDSPCGAGPCAGPSPMESRCLH